MNDLCVEAAYKSIIKHGEELCGDMVQIIRDGNETIMVLADGLGSGVKANILATLTSKIICTMMAAKMSVEECVSTIVETLPVCRTRGVAYATFTIIKISNDEAHIIQYDNPAVILLRNGKSYDYPTETHIIAGKNITESRIKLLNDDVFIAMSDGAIYAGVGETMNFGWQRPEIVSFMEENYSVKNSAQTVANLLVDACNDLYVHKPGDDTTVAALRVRKRSVANLLFGPPEKDDDLEKMMSLFFESDGRHIVSGGTTSSLVAKYLDEELITTLDYIDPEVPPTAKIEGVDLVTEGVLTINKVVEYAKDHNGEKVFFEKWHKGKDGASQIARELFDDATDINFFVGRAINPAHQNPNLPIGFNIKMQLVTELCENLKKMGKTVNVSYF